jgi:hypothetical protein
MLIGAEISGRVVESYQVMEAGRIAGHHWTSIWIVPAAMAFGVVLLFAALFRETLAPKPSGAAERRAA